MFPSCYSNLPKNGAYANTSVTKVAVGVFVVYVLHTCWVLYGFVYTKPCDTRGDSCITPYFAENPQLSIFVTLDPSDVEGHSLLHQENEFDIFTKFERKVNVPLPKATRSNGTLFAVIYVHSGSGAPWEDSRHASYATRLTSYTTRHPPGMTASLSEDTAQEEDEEQQPAPGSVSPAPVSLWHSRLCLSIMAEKFSFSKGAVPSDVRRYMKGMKKEDVKKKMYLPFMVVDELQIRMKDFLEINESTTEVHLTVTYENISLRKFRLWSHMRDVVYSLKHFGFTEHQVDEFKGVITDTNVYILALTIFAAILNLLFEFLAIKNDISFWRKKTTMAGMSKRSVLWRCFSTLVIFLHLLVKQTNWLLLIPTGVGVVLELWKLKKAFSIQDDKFDEPERLTTGYDSQGMRFLSYLLCPVCISGVTYSLLYLKNKSWYSWFLSSLITGVYAFGFLSGCPQLYVNYKLKSVEHLQSSIYMYKGLSTFINDILSTVLTVPTHPLACFRDDVIFLLHLYQRRQKEDVLKSDCSGSYKKCDWSMKPKQAAPACIHIPEPSCPSMLF
ncbi:cleft lip and palate transmembrane protein 1-like protein [Clupea harengus]|uniref:Lipid scramblase CLPTM1L n=1 Tax=Clupea harengus TaxID=7950 RepID=A0A6P8G8V3_CLUHA|nr:cleft lip and palate transmembrane protein 1-like protein [Clupea harengus]